MIFPGNPTIDFLSMDVEGSEYPILRTIPFDKVDIRMIMIEVNHSPKQKIHNYMINNGYTLLKELPIDMVYKKKIA